MYKAGRAKPQGRVPSPALSPRQDGQALPPSSSGSPARKSPSRIPKSITADTRFNGLRVNRNHLDVNLPDNAHSLRANQALSAWSRPPTAENPAQQARPSSAGTTNASRPRLPSLLARRLPGTSHAPDREAAGMRRGEPVPGRQESSSGPPLQEVRRRHATPRCRTGLPARTPAARGGHRVRRGTSRCAASAHFNDRIPSPVQ